MCIGKKKQIWKKSSFSDIKAKSSFSHKNGFQKQKDTFLNPSIQASLSAKKNNSTINTMASCALREKG